MYPDVVVVGAGVIGAACAHALTAAGCAVTVVDRGAPASGTTAAGEGNVLVSDKAPGPELDLAMLSRRLWPALADELGDIEWEAKGGLVVATTEAAAQPLLDFMRDQRAVGVDAREVPAGLVHELEPHLTRAVTAAVHYPQDAQLQPVLAATALLAEVTRRGGVIRPHTPVSTVDTGRDGRVRGVRVADGVIPCGAVINACGPWAGDFARAAGVPIAILPRRGIVLVTAALPLVVRHKVYDADYVGAVVSDDAALQTSSVVESTAAGPVLIGSSRQRVGFAERVDAHVLRALARKAVGLFPVLATVPVMRAYGGFRPYAPDHVPVIGPDPRLPGMWHATGHEGAGIGLAAATGRLIADLVTGAAPVIDLAPFRVDRPAVLEAA
ncbi:glycine/D-amino acid oxidase-like deaminating enzyme [Herbihabitans rhizosphaerae]|uniref:Glycine/D-amino acid oxidase-like deaminating enzyme n=1 Tax=Herbihabitans rhizosphaerae TaxID=1872711 RepID=A0A4Q7KFF0_9PSEU|nr:glycine/D-amino acid oxidase-like deaminating enzyme [Herbihabitans rhizosphaerae]